MHIREWQDTYISFNWEENLENGEWDHLFTLVQRGDKQWRRAIEAVIRGDLESLRLILEAGLDIEGLFPVTWAEIIRCCHYGSSVCLQADAYGNTGMEDEGTRRITLMHWAARCDQVDVLKLLMHHGADIDCASIPTIFQVHFTPLSEAVLASNSDAVKLLIEAGAGINWHIECAETSQPFSDDLLQRSLYLVSEFPNATFQSSSRDIILYLFQQGLDVDLRRVFGNPLMHMAVQTCYSDIVRALLDHGASCEGTLISFVKFNAGEAVLDLMLANGASSDALEPLFIEPSRKLPIDPGKLSTMELVLSKLDTFWQSDQPHRWLVRAASQADFGIVKYLLDTGVDVNSTDQQGRTALMAASYSHNNPEMVSVLLANGADTHQQVHSVYNRPFGTGLTALHCAACGHRLGTVRLLLEAGADVDARTSHGFTPFLSMLVGTELGWWSADEDAKAGFGLTLALLVEAGAESIARTEDGKTALHLVARFPRRFLTDPVSPTRLLVQLGADPYVQDDEGKLPVDYIKDSNVHDLRPLRDYLMLQTSDYELVLRAMQV